MVNIELTITHLGDTEAGIITVMCMEGEPREMGKIKFESPSDQRWWLMVLMEMHPFVRLAEESKSYDPKLNELYGKCCSH
ncbi:MAG: hypothetical protein A4E32_01377 [Methanomassiliicoccales archaeon PtaU1.Bin124]|nr:MAG: hypothetical protein A4E32_01377 [Methanomassiliicoccales archaeon PtaU1.Bin124]